MNLDDISDVELFAEVNKRGLNKFLLKIPKEKLSAALNKMKTKLSVDQVFESVGGLRRTRKFSVYDIDNGSAERDMVMVPLSAVSPKISLDEFLSTFCDLANYADHRLEIACVLQFGRLYDASECILDNSLWWLDFSSKVNGIMSTARSLLEETINHLSPHNGKGGEGSRLAKVDRRLLYLYKVASDSLHHSADRGESFVKFSIKAHELFYDRFYDRAKEVFLQIEEESLGIQRGLEDFEYGSFEFRLHKVARNGYFEFMGGKLL